MKNTKKLGYILGNNGTWIMLIIPLFGKVFSKVLWHPERESAILLSLLQTAVLSVLTVDTMGWPSELLGSFKTYSRKPQHYAGQ